jgi:hypothetical protein
MSVESTIISHFASSFFNNSILLSFFFASTSSTPTKSNKQKKDRFSIHQTLFGNKIHKTEMENSFLRFFFAFKIKEENMRDVKSTKKSIFKVDYILISSDVTFISMFDVRCDRQAKCLRTSIMKY